MQQSQKIKISEEVAKEYRNACLNQANGGYESMRAFAIEHEKEYKFLSSMSRKRKIIEENIEAMKMTKSKLFFGTLTFNEIKDKNKEECKRKESMIFLNKVFREWLLVEEFGEENDRYHIHFIGCADKVNPKDFEEWHSREDWRQIKTKKDKKIVSKYLCDYVSKQLPKIRRNKRLIECHNAYKSGLKWSNLQFDCLAKPCYGSIVAIDLFED